MVSRLLSTVLLASTVSIIGGVQPAHAAGNVYYLSPTGSDSNPGTEDDPWRSAAHAASTLQAGDTAIFEDGTYDETVATTFANTGSAGNPITIKARNKHHAKLNYIGLNSVSKIVVSSKQYVVIQDFEITQDAKGTTNADSFINAISSSNSTFIGNEVHGGYGRAISGFGGDNLVVEANTIYDINGQGVYLSNVGSPVVRNNEISEVVNTGVYAAHGTRSAAISNNHIHAATNTMSYGILLGGTTSATGAYDPNGFEAYNAVAWNNRIISDVVGKIQYAVTFAGSTDSAFFNNVVIGSQYAVRTMTGGGTTAGWQPVPTNPTVKNNIFTGITTAARLLSYTPAVFTSDYNLYYNTAGTPTETHGLTGDPKFVEPDTELNLRSGSPAIDAGPPLTFTGFDNESIDVSYDVAGVQRTGTSWNLGVWAQEPTVLFTDGFENGIGSWSTSAMQAVEEASGGNHVYTQPAVSGTSTQTRAVAGSVSWRSYEFNARVKFNEFLESSSFLYLYARYADADNNYSMEFRGHSTTGSIKLIRKVNGTVIPVVEKVNWQPPAGWHNVKFTVDGIELRVYLDGVLLLSGSDTKVAAGKIAVSVFRTDVYIDDVIVTEIDAATAPSGPHPATVTGGTYYVSPSGDDENPGTQAQPWKTLAHAASYAKAGNTVIFEDGVYPETQVAYFEQSGTASQRIVFKARNKHKAKIIYQDMPFTKLFVQGKSYITLQDFEITQNVKGFNTADILVRVIGGSNYVSVLGNKVHKGYEDAIKGNLIHDYLVEGNYVYDMFHEGVDFVNVWDSVIRGNEAFEVGRVPLMVKGGSKNIQIYNNYVHNRDVATIYGITLGGQTGYASTADYTTSGYEAWNVVAYNNVVISENPGKITNAIAFLGSKNSAAYNNIVSGAQYAVRLIVPNNTAVTVGWDWNPQNEGAKVKNNILIDSTLNAIGLGVGQLASGLQDDYNLFYGNVAQPSETNGVYASPAFVDAANGDWHLANGSPAIAAALPIPTFTLYDNQTTIDISLDRDGLQRGSTSWDIGPYKYVP